MWRFVVLCLLPCVGAYYKPVIGSRFQIQLALGSNQPFDYHSMWADMYEVDLWFVTPAQIQEIHASHNVRSIMAKRMDLAHSKGCDGILTDNVDAWQASNGFGITSEQQLDYNKYLAHQAHSKGLCIGLINDISHIPELVPYFDWALNEGCHKTDWACQKYHHFLDAQKPVFNLEYVTSHHVSSTDLLKCTQHHPYGMRTQFKLQSLTAWTQHCPGQ